MRNNLDKNNSLRGLKANVRGNNFERYVELSCIHYKRSGVADIQKTPEPMQIVRPLNQRRNRFEAVFTKRAQPDFKGVLQGGRAILFEAKRT